LKLGGGYDVPPPALTETTSVPGRDPRYADVADADIPGRSRSRHVARFLRTGSPRSRPTCDRQAGPRGAQATAPCARQVPGGIPTTRSWVSTSDRRAARLRPRRRAPAARLAVPRRRVAGGRRHGAVAAQGTAKPPADRRGTSRGDRAVPGPRATRALCYDRPRPFVGGSSQSEHVLAIGQIIVSIGLIASVLLQRGGPGCPGPSAATPPCTAAGAASSGACGSSRSSLHSFRRLLVAS